MLLAKVLFETNKNHAFQELIFSLEQFFLSPSFFKMGPINKLPTELISKIFDFIEKDKIETSHAPIHFIQIPSLDLLQCQLICKKWKSIAQSIFYKDIYISKETSISNLLKHLLTLKTTWLRWWNWSTSITTINRRCISYLFLSLVQLRVYVPISRPSTPIEKQEISFGL